MDPFQESHSVEEYKRRLGMQHATSNTSEKYGSLWSQP